MWFARISDDESEMQTDMSVIGQKLSGGTTLVSERNGDIRNSTDSLWEIC